MADGVKFTRESADRIARTVKTVEKLANDISRPPRTKFTKKTLDVISVYNNDTQYAPQYSLAWIRTYDSSENYHNIRRASYPGVSQVCILTSEFEQGDTGMAWNSGIHPVLTEDYAELDISANPRLGVSPDTWCARADQLGPLTVVGSYDGEQPTGDGIPEGAGLVMAEITGERGTPIIIYDHMGVRYTVYTILLSSGFSVDYSLTDPRNVDISAIEGL